MLAATICFVSVLCTATLGSFGMGSASVVASVGSGGVPAALQDSANSVLVQGEDVYRVPSNNECLMFNEFFAAAAILVSIVYYAIVKLSLMAMGAVVMSPPSPHPVYANEGSSSSSNCDSDSCSSASSCSSSDDDDDDEDDDRDEDCGGEDGEQRNQLPRGYGDDGEIRREFHSNEQLRGYTVPVRKSSSRRWHAAAAVEMKRVEPIFTIGEEEGHGEDGEGINEQARAAPAKSNGESEASTTGTEAATNAAQQQPAEEGQQQQQKQEIEPDEFTTIVQVSSLSASSSSSSSLSEWVSYDEEMGSKGDRRGAPGAPPGARGGGASERGREGAHARRSGRIRREKKGHAPRSEKFSAIKIWTNIYGLSLGIYCLVYSLLQPNELSAFVFCVATLLCGVCETAVPCMKHYVFSGYRYREVGEHIDAAASAAAAAGSGLPGRAGVQRKRGQGGGGGGGGGEGAMTMCKRIIGWICLCNRQIGREVSESAASSMKSMVRGSAKEAARMRSRIASGPKMMHMHRSRSSASSSWYQRICCCFLCCLGGRRGRGCGRSYHRGRKNSSSSCAFIGSGVLAMPVLIMLIAGGLGCKLAACLVASSSPSSSSGHSSLSGLFMHAVAQPRGSISPDSGTSVAYMAVSILFPIVGVLMLKSMKRARNVRQTMELSVPVCGLNSLCIICLVVIQGRGCITDHLYSTVQIPAAASPSASNNNYYYYYPTSPTAAAAPSYPPASPEFLAQAMNDSEAAIGSSLLQPPSSPPPPPPASAMDEASPPNGTAQHMVPGFFSSSSSASGEYSHASIPSASSIASHMQQQQQVYSAAAGDSDASDAHKLQGKSVTVLEPYPILAAMVLPFPLVCSVVCIVSAWRNHRVMDIAASTFLAYASRQFHREDSPWSPSSSTQGGADGSALGTLALAFGMLACMGLAAYRMGLGDDHGHFHARQFSVLRRKAGRDMVLGLA